MNMNTCVLLKSLKLIQHSKFNFNKFANLNTFNRKTSFYKINSKNKSEIKEQKFSKNDLKIRLSSLEYSVTQEKGTEPPFSGEYMDNKEKGIYSCIVCDENLFDSNHKYNSGTGWPSFYQGNTENISLKSDSSHFMIRTEIKCKNCGSHLGHIFDDGPEPTFKRYCVNSCSLLFKKK